MGSSRFSMDLGDDESLALRRLAAYHQRTMAAQLRYMIRHQAQELGLWPMSRPQLVQAEKAREKGAREKGSGSIFRRKI